MKLPYDHSLLLISMEGENHGTIESRLLKEKIRFSTPEEMLLRIEQMLDVQNSPQSTETLRKFYARRKSSAAPALTLFEHDFALDADPRRNFLLAIRSRHYAEWQGTMYHFDSRPPQPFQSIIELANLLHQNEYFS